MYVGLLTFNLYNNLYKEVPPHRTGATRDAASERRRTPLPRTPVNKVSGVPRRRLHCEFIGACLTSRVEGKSEAECWGREPTTSRAWSKTARQRHGCGGFGVGRGHGCHALIQARY